MPKKQIQNYKILLVDDDPNIHELTRVLLNTMPISTTLHAFYDVQTALQYLEGHTVDLVLLDLCLTVPHDGSRLIIELSNNAKNGWDVPPILIMSVEQNGDLVDYVSELGAVDYLQKPLNAADFVRAVQTCLAMPKELANQRFNAALTQLD